MKTVTTFPRKVTEEPDVRIPMEDGVMLSARIWLPEDARANPVPAILEHLPYRKRDGTIARDQLTHPYLAGHGYACIRVDMRGNGDSEGLMEDEYTRQEWDDALAVMDWVRAQPWSTGDWGMMGISWGGFNALQLAALNPPGLKAVISLCSTVDRYADDIHYKGGCMLGENLGWAAHMLAYSSRPPDPEVAGEGWRDMWLKRLTAQPFLLETWLGHQRRDDYWRHGSVCEDYGAIEAAVLAIGGWHDGYRNTPAHLVRNLSAPVKAMVGPWIHKYPHFAGPKPAIGFLQEALRWWDRWLKGVETGVEAEPRERLYLMDAVPPERWVDERPGRWIGLDSDAPFETLHLTPDGLGADQDPIALPVRSPETCGDGAGEYFPAVSGPELPGDQAEDDALSLSFDQPPTGADRDIIGAARVTLQLRPNGTKGQLALRLCDVRPDGQVTLIAHGFLNLTHRSSHEFPEDLMPGKEIEVEVALDQCACRLPGRHGLRLSISTAYWPFIWPAPENKGAVVTGGTLHLPVLDEADAEVTFDPPEGAPPWEADQLRLPSMTREVERLPDGRRLIRITNDEGEVRDRGHGLITGSRSVEEWTIHPEDPLSAEGRCTLETRTAREGWDVRVRCDAGLTADAEAWYPRARIEALENGETVFEKGFESRIARDGV
ncbi:MAG: CocE/NonD family hydrolase [Paracoccaceae bacterium]|nr:CocE/NonD family hydrolase [Paracoccaceae bacterium]